MYFTLDDYKKIWNWFKLNSIKDSELPEVTDLRGNELITLVLNNKSVRIILYDLLKYIESFSTDGLLNITENYGLKNITIYLAILAIPVSNRKLGLIITFLNEDNNWVIYLFLGESIYQWNSIALWINIIDSTILKGNSIPDEEDLTYVIKDNVSTVKFKDKIYNPAVFTGLGRVYLRKNILLIEDSETNCNRIANLLILSMISRENTIYIILYDYDLNGLKIVIPEGCILKFEGGKITNGTIVLNDTTIVSYNNTIKDYINADILGNYSVGLCLFDTDLGKPKWWNGTAWVDSNGNSIGDIK